MSQKQRLSVLESMYTPFEDSINNKQVIILWSKHSLLNLTFGRVV